MISASHAMRAIIVESQTKIQEKGFSQIYKDVTELY